MDCIITDPVVEFERALKRDLDILHEHIGELQPYMGSESLKFAVQAGFPPQMAYTVADTSTYSGVPVSALYRAEKAGQLKFKRFGKKYALIRVTEMDRWMEEKDADDGS